MQLTNHLEAGQILVGCEETDKHRLLDKMTEALLSPRVRRLNPSVDKNILSEDIFRRESERPTTTGNGLAFPHARVEGFSGIGISLAIMKRPIDFGGSGDGVRLACLIVAPQEAPMATLKVMARIAQFFRNAANRDALLSASSGEEVVALLATGELSLDIPVTARDIMVPPSTRVRPDTPLREVARTMHAQRLQAMAVVDEDERLVGEITADGLFQFGLPEFFQHLKSVSFISEFDPFEKYFEHEAHSVAKQLVCLKICRMRPEATLLEIVFALAVQRFVQVYVVDANDRWVGMIDRAAVLNNVINW